MQKKFTKKNAVAFFAKKVWNFKPKTTLETCNELLLSDAKREKYCPCRNIIHKLKNI